MNCTYCPWKAHSDPLHFDSMTVGGHPETTGGTWPLFKPDAQEEIEKKAKMMFDALKHIEYCTNDAMTAALARVAIEKVLMK